MVHLLHRLYNVDAPVSTLPCETWHSRYAARTMNRKSTPKCLSHLLQIDTDSDKVRYTCFLN